MCLTFRCQGIISYFFGVRRVISICFLFLQIAGCVAGPGAVRVVGPAELYRNDTPLEFLWVDEPEGDTRDGTPVVPMVGYYL